MLRPSPVPPVRRAAVTVLLVVVPALVAVAVLASCGTSGRNLRTPATNAVSPTRSSTPRASSSTTTSRPPGSLAPSALALTSPDFGSGESLPPTSTCVGAPPELRWTGVPTDAAQLVLAVVDTDTRTVQWLVTGIAPTDGSIASETLPAGAKALTNSYDRAGWTPPCPPAGSTHHYDFVVLALPSTITIPTATPATEAYERIRQAAGEHVATLSAVVVR